LTTKLNVFLLQILFTVNSVEVVVHKKNIFLTYFPSSFLIPQLSQTSE